MSKKSYWLRFILTILILLFLPYDISYNTSLLFTLEGLFYGRDGIVHSPIIVQVVNIALITVPSAYFHYRMSDYDGKKQLIQLAIYVYILTIVVMWIIVPNQVYGLYNPSYTESASRFLTNYGSMLLLIEVLFPILRRYYENPFARYLSTDRWTLILYLVLLFAPISVSFYTTGVTPQRYSIIIFFVSLGYNGAINLGFNGETTGTLLNFRLGMFPVASLSLFVLFPMIYLLSVLQDYKRGNATKRKLVLSVLLAASVFIFQTFSLILSVIFGVPGLGIPTPIVLIVAFLYKEHGNTVEEEMKPQALKSDTSSIVKVPLTYLAISRIKKLLSRSD